MSLRALIFIGLLFLYTGIFSQDYFSYGGGNFSGLSQVIANPAAAADNRLKLDVIVAGADLTFNNSWFGIKREALKRSNNKLPASWKNATPNVPDNVFKNFTLIGTGKNRGLILESRILLPSALFQIDAKNSVAFTWSIRQFANVDGFSQQLANLFEKELDLSVTQNNRVQNRNLAAVQMSWVEYGFTYARVIKDRHKHFIKAGITPKLVQGLESVYLVVKELDFLFSTKDTLSYFNTDFSYAHSSNFNSPFKNGNSIGGLLSNATRPRPGLDLGIIYEWRPDHQKYKYRTDAKHYAWRKDLNKYKLKLGASIVDIGKIKFDKQGTYYDLDVSVRRDNFTKFTTVKNYAEFDSLLRTDFSTQGQGGKYAIFLPTAFNLQADYALSQLFYLNLSAHLSNFNKSNLYRVYNYSAICFAPRIEHYWFDVSVPFTYNTLSARRSEYIMTGLNIRLGPLTFGSNDVIPLFKGDISSFNVYAILKVSIPYKRMNDQDHDGVKDKRDKCPDDPGELALDGCPDADHDLIPDKADACPHQPGLAAFRGCPDTDQDGITDGEDACPHEKGSLALKGCPDLDGDSIADKDDACPEARGPKQFKGCPDTDGDGIIDKDDLCPAVKGLSKYKGCPDRDNDAVHDGIDQCPDIAGPPGNNGCPWPDTDKDGIIDQQDSCITVPGVAEFKGCPPPVKLASAEKRILQKAFASLEFESGKDIIKPGSYSSLTALAKLLLAHKTEWTLKLSGHTDNEGTEADNLVLSEKRAKAVQRYLVKKGVPVENTSVEWFGQTQGIADNATKEGKQKNRRVEMTLLMKVE